MSNRAAGSGPSALRHITAWLSDLANLTAGSQPLADVKAKLAAYAVTLAEQFPVGAFTRGSLEHVARINRFFPSYAEVRTPLAEWWRDNRPAPRQLAAPPSPAEPLGADPPPRAPPSEAEQAAIHAQLAALVAELKAKHIEAEPPGPPKPYHLTPAQLDEAYRHAGVPGPRGKPAEATPAPDYRADAKAAQHAS